MEHSRPIFLPVILGTPRQGRMSEHAAKVLVEKGLSGRRLGVEMDNYYFSAKCLETLRQELPNAIIGDATALENEGDANAEDVEEHHRRRHHQL